MPKPGDFWIGGLKRYEERNRKRLERKEMKAEAISEILGFYTAVLYVGMPVAGVIFGLEMILK